MIKDYNKKWTELIKKLNIGDYIEAPVVEIQRFGIFLDIGEDFRGLVLVTNISRLTHGIEDYPQKGELVRAEILGFSEHPLHTEHSYVSLKIEVAPHK